MCASLENLALPAATSEASRSVVAIEPFQAAVAAILGVLEQERHDGMDAWALCSERGGRIRQTRPPDRKAYGVKNGDGVGIVKLAAVFKDLLSLAIEPTSWWLKRAFWLTIIVLGVWMRLE